MSIARAKRMVGLFIVVEDDFCSVSEIHVEESKGYLCRCLGKAPDPETKKR